MKNNKKNLRGGKRVPFMIQNAVKRVAYVAGETYKRDKNFDNLADSIKKSFMDSTMEASAELLKNAVDLRYSQSFRSGFLRRGDLFSNANDSFFMETTKSVNRQKENNVLNALTTVPNIRPPYVVKKFEVGKRLSGKFKTIEKGPYHQSMRHVLLDTESDYGNSKNKNKMPFRKATDPRSQ